MMTIFRNSIRDGTKYYFLWSRSLRATQNCIGIVRHENSSQDIDAQWSKIEDNGERRKDQKLRLRNFDARHGRVETGAVARIETEWMALKEEKVPYTSGKKKASVRKETNALSGTTPKILRKSQKTLPPHLLSHRCHEVEPCRYYLKGTCTNLYEITLWVLASSWVSSLQNWKRVAKPGISVCFRIIRLMNNQTKSQRKATIPTKEEISDDNNAVAIVKIVQNWVASRKTRKHWFLKEGNIPGENPMQRVLGPIRRIRFTQSTLLQASIREQKGPSLRKIASQKSSSAKSLRYGNLRTGPMKSLKDDTDAPEARHETLPTNTYKLKEKDKSYILLTRGGMGTSGCVNKRAREKRVSSGIWSL